MRSGKHTRWLFWAGALVLMTASGCAGLCQELGIPVVVSERSGFATIMQGPPPTLVPPPGTDLKPQPVPVPEQVSLMAQKVASAEDDRKALAARLQLLETQLLEKEKALVQGSLEVRDATQQVHNARQDIERWKQETDTLRTKLQNMEKENRETLEAVIRSMEQVVDRDPNKAPLPTAVPKTPTGVQ